ncbi:MAG: putative sulfur carrier protein [Candidatus Woesearchaeota archaeon]|nr:putative sulfur carrier protein [Candidatus Woesearchaeota archaeon]
MSLDKIEADYTLDCKGMVCPIPIVRLKQKIGELEPGQTLEMIATDSAVDSDVSAWCNSTGNEYLDYREEDNTYYVYVRVPLN